MFSKILIANRGEIACRVIRTAKRLGYATVAVFSDADRDAPHVALADEAVHIGPSPAAESYLRIDVILEAARKTGADAIHPGYGFLSENAAFAKACADANVVFIGPPASAITAMGDKALAKRRMLDAGVPCAPGYLGADQSDTALMAEAAKLGYPLLVKAVAGGGGRGMRLVRETAELQAGIEGARREAISAFGDGTLMLERLIDNGRHIEIQVFADNHGNAVYLGERDCTAQRRRQKVIEEAPSPVVSQAMRESMGNDAVAAALAVGYRGAGTVEFIVDEHLKHYFLEMNTRLQVEHPVTEMVTGYDLVEWQLQVAAGEPLPARQSDITLTGHAIEARLYVEDPYTGFAPQTGTIAWWRPAAALQINDAGSGLAGGGARGVRIDAGIREGSVVSPFYDPMVAKIIVHGRDRNDAIRRLRATLASSPLLGLKNNGKFLSDLVDHPAFRKAEMTTTLIDQWLDQGEALLQAPVPNDAAWQVAAAAIAMQNGSSWRANSVAAYGFQLQCGDTVRVVRVHPDRHGQLTIALDGTANQESAKVLNFEDCTLRLELGGVVQSAIAVMAGPNLHLAYAGQSHVFTEVSAFPNVDAQKDASRARSPVAGKVTQVLVAVGDAVTLGQQLACVEAMKMEMWLCAEAAGTVKALHAKAGDQVESGALLLELELEIAPS